MSVLADVSSQQRRRMARFLLNSQQKLDSGCVAEQQKENNVYWLVVRNYVVSFI